ncbi:2-hydroxyacyl-CoA dehydratase family protein [Ideonella sp. DXS22W]|uniref:2-hydroxyacyl-CoA dehydratase family protein n=1 Tax=Pseudaquabacterium inlustre TaxID=2984192 RepID=A0ABU9CLP0_9BURK
MSNDKQLASTLAAGEKQKTWFAALRRDVFEQRKPYAIINADTPHDLFHVLGIPVVTNQWWAAVIAAKRLSTDYLDGMNARGFHEDLCRYCSMGLASSLIDLGERSPWGGLPQPALLCARLTCDCMQRVFAQWADRLGAPFFALEAPGTKALPAKWWELSRDRWEELCEPDRLDLAVQELQELTGVLEGIAGRKLDLDALRAFLDKVNQQEEILEDVREMIATAPKCPVRIGEQIPNVMATQWHRGSDWALNHARAFRDEVRARVDAGIAACPGERKRLMWVGAGLWHNTAFYNAFEESHGATFVWSMYLPFGPDWYIRHMGPGADQPMRALASRVVTMNEVLHNPPYAPAWMVREAERNRIDGAVVLMPKGNRPAASGTLFITAALEGAGIPTLLIESDMVDARGWNEQAMRERMVQFIEERL